MLMKLTPRVHAFVSSLNFRGCDVDQSSLVNICKIRSKETQQEEKEPRVNFINFFYAQLAFKRADPKWSKKTVKSAVSFFNFGTYVCKSCA